MFFYLINHEFQPFNKSTISTVIRHLGRDCRDPESKEGGNILFKDMLSIEIVYPYTLDTSNPCWYDELLVCSIWLRLIRNQLVFYK